MWKGLTRTMATGTIRPNAALLPLPFSNRVVPVNTAPRDFDPERDLPEGFPDFLASLHAALTLRQRALVARRENALAEARAGKLPSYPPPSVATVSSWKIELPAWCADQRNQMTGPADDAELVVKMLNSRSAGRDAGPGGFDGEHLGTKRAGHQEHSGSANGTADLLRPQAQ